MSTASRIRKDIERFREAEKRYKALMRLKANSDFRQLILDGLFKDELTRVVLDRHNASPEDLVKLTKEADAISYLDGFFKEIEEHGSTAHYRITEGLKLLDELGEDE